MNGFVTFGYVGLSCVHRGQGRPRLPRAFICGKPLVSAYAAARKPQRARQKRRLKRHGHCSSDFFPLFCLFFGR